MVKNKNLSLQKSAEKIALRAFSEQKLILRVADDTGVIQNIEGKDIPALIQKGYMPRQAANGYYYLSRGLLGGGSDSLDDLLRKLANKPAEQRTIFISYNWAQKETAQKLHQAFEKRGFLVVRDTTELGDHSNLARFMQLVNNPDIDYVLPIISSKYLKSPNCMYEVSRLLQRDEWEKIVIPYIVSGDDNPNIYRGTGAYSAYWEEQLIKERDPSEQEKIQAIIRAIEPFGNFISNRINPDEAKLVESEYQPLFDLIDTNEAANHSFRFKELASLLDEAQRLEKLEKFEDAQIKYQAAIEVSAQMTHLPAVDSWIGRAYGSYAEFLLNNKDNMLITEDSINIGKFQRIANNFGYTWSMQLSAESHQNFLSDSRENVSRKHGVLNQISSEYNVFSDLLSHGIPSVMLLQCLFHRYVAPYLPSNQNRALKNEELEKLSSIRENLSKFKIHFRFLKDKLGDGEDFVWMNSKIKHLAHDVRIILHANQTTVAKFSEVESSYERLREKMEAMTKLIENTSNDTVIFETSSSTNLWLPFFQAQIAGNPRNLPLSGDYLQLSSKANMTL